jgi:OHCU decarboxylase
MAHYQASSTTPNTIVSQIAHYQIYKNLDWLNKMPRAEAESVFIDCCGSTEWARQMAEARPFVMLEDLFQTAETRWYALSPSDQLEAFAAHPKIGSKTPAEEQPSASAEWSKGEQSEVSKAGDRVLNELATANRLYQDKFGFIFIVCATGKTAEEMLAICRARLGNSIETELNLAAVEQGKITEIRLNKLLEK